MTIPPSPTTRPHRRLWTNAAFNLAGVILPAAVALVCTPPLLAAIGPSLFGLATIQLAVLVLASVNDFGVSRAVVLVAIEKGGFQALTLRLEAVRAGVELVTLLALILGALAILSFCVAMALGVAATDDRLLSWLLVILAAAIALPTLPLRARLEIEERFGILNLLRSLGSSLLFASPLVAAWIMPSLTSIALSHILSRALLLLLFAAVAGRGMFRGLPAALRRIVSTARTNGMALAALPVHAELLRRGSWLGLAGLVSMLIGYADRFVLSMTLGAAYVANYAVAAEMATKIWLVVGAFSAAATPRIAAGFKSGENSWKPHFNILAVAVAGTALLAHSIFTLAGKPLLALWLGKEFHLEMAQLLAILSCGIAINCLSQMNYVLLLIKGGEQPLAKLQFILLPVTVAASAIGAWTAGPKGVAAAFSIRLLLDAFIVRALLSRRAGNIGISAMQITIAAGIALALLLSS